MSRGGLLVPALMSLWSSDDEFAGHYRRYNHHSPTQVLLSAGFELVALSGFFSLLVPLLFFFGLSQAHLGHGRSKTLTRRLSIMIGVLMERVLGVELPIIKCFIA